MVWGHPHLGNLHISTINPGSPRNIALLARRCRKRSVLSKVRRLGPIFEGLKPLKCMAMYGEFRIIIPFFGLKIKKDSNIYIYIYGGFGMIISCLKGLSIKNIVQTTNYMGVCPRSHWTRDTQNGDFNRNKKGDLGVQNCETHPKKNDNLIANRGSAQTIHFGERKHM